jgi:hypothetical protein
MTSNQNEMKSISGEGYTIKTHEGMCSYKEEIFFFNYSKSKLAFTTAVISFSIAETSFMP